MEISIPFNINESDILDHNVIDDRRKYDKESPEGYFTTDSEIIDGNELWEITADMTPHVWTSGEEAAEEYVKDQILFKDDGTGTDVVTRVVSAGTATILKQPEEYTSIAGFYRPAWDARYTIVDTNASTNYSGFETVPGDNITHKLYKDATSSTGWRYKISYVGSEQYWDTIYRTTSGDLSMVRKNNYGSYYGVYIWYDGDAISPLNEDDDPYIGLQYVYNGETYRVMEHKTTYTKEAPHRVVDEWSIAKLKTRDKSFTYTKEATVATEITSVYEIVPDTANSTGNYDWIGRHFIQRGSNLYMRTTVSDSSAPKLYKDVTTNQYATVETISEFPSGFALTGVTNFLNPFDGKNYTRLLQSDSVTYTINVSQAMDTIAISGLIASNISAVFKDDNGVVVSQMDSYEPQMYRDSDNVLPDYYTTAIIYSIAENPIPVGGTVELSIEYSGDVEIGSICFGLKANAGFTNLAFTNKFVDYSPYENNDKFGIMYIPGVRINSHSGTVDVPISSYDMMMRLWTSIAGGTVIVNGSDSTDNAPPNSDNGIFASTMLIGRMSNFQLKTNLKNKKLDDLATYSFTIEENI